MNPKIESTLNNLKPTATGQTSNNNNNNNNKNKI